MEVIEARQNWLTKNLAIPIEQKIRSEINEAENLDFTRLSALFVASSPGFEPGAFRLGGGPSILLRYEDIYEILSI